MMFGSVNEFWTYAASFRDYVKHSNRSLIHTTIVSAKFNPLHFTELPWYLEGKWTLWNVQTRKKDK